MDPVLGTAGKLGPLGLRGGADDDESGRRFGKLILE